MSVLGQHRLSKHGSVSLKFLMTNVVAAFCQNVKEINRV